MALYSALVAYVMLTAALFRSFDGPDPVSLGLVLASLATALAGCCWRRPVPTGLVARRLVPVVVGGLMAGEICWLLLAPPSVYRSYPQHDPPLFVFRLGVVVLGLLAASYAWNGMPLGRWRFAGFLAVYAVVGSWPLLAATMRPGIDVWHLQQAASAELLRGRDPYAADWPNVYGPGDTRYVGPEMLKDGRVQSFPYPPLSLALAVLGYLVGDVRWGLLLAILGTAALMVATGRRLGLPAGHPAELVAAALLCHPRGLLVLETAWTEPFVALALAAGVWAMAGARQRVTAGALAAALAMKQYVFLALPALWMSRQLGRRQVAAAVALAGLTVVPFVLWDRAALWHGLVDFHLYSPFRADSLSVLAAVPGAAGHPLSATLSLMAAAVVAAVVLRYGVPGLAHATLGSAAIFLAFFVFSKAAHLNYYWLTGVLLALAVLIAVAEQSRQEAASPRSPAGGG